MPELVSDDEEDEKDDSTVKRPLRTASMLAKKRIKEAGQKDRKSETADMRNDEKNRSRGSRNRRELKVHPPP